MRMLKYAILLIIAMFIFGYMTHHMSLSETPKEQPLTMERFEEQWKIIVDTHIRPLPNTREARMACFQKLITSGLSSCLNDRYAEYLTRENFNKVLATLQGSFTGIGLVISEKKIPVAIIEITKNSPAEKSGEFQIGDLIIQVNGEDVSKDPYHVVSAKIQGDIDTSVTIRVQRGGVKRNPVTLIRKEIFVKSISTQDIDDEITYMRIYGFNEHTPREFLYQVSMRLMSILPDGKEHVDSRARKFVWDLRENPGGLLDSVVTMSYFFSSDPNQIIVTVRSRKEEKIVRIGDLKTNPFIMEPGVFRDIKGVVLINGESASASEIFATFMHEVTGAPRIGKKSHGKGSVQRTFRLSRGDALVFTVAEYFVGNKKTRIEKTGILPDYEVKQATTVSSKNTAIIELVDPQKDPQLKKAIEILRER